MAIPFCILGVYNMANGLEHIADILKRLNDELKLDNDNGRENKMSQQQHYDQVMMEQHQQELQQQERKMNYNELRKINVSDHIEKKNGLSYLSWAWAVDTLLQQDPTATWTYGEPKQFGETLMVFCTVHAFGKSMTAQLPVLNFRNQAIPNPDAMAVNTAMQRCLAKAIALHGIGLYIYSGEDIPESEQPALKAVSSKDFL